MSVTRNLSPASWRKPSEMVRTAVLVPAAMTPVRASRRSRLRAPSTTVAPREASRSEVAFPIPLLAPVMMTTLPLIPDMGILLDAQPIDEESDHALRTAILLRGHAQACDCMKEFI